MNKNIWHLLGILTLTLAVSACGYSKEDIALAKIQASEELQDKIEDALGTCEIQIEGVLMDDGCLEDEFSYGGDFWDCELNRPSEMLTDADCVRYELRL